jgi:hypothetical protein
VKFQKIIERETRKCLKSYQKMEEASDRISEQAPANDDYKQSFTEEAMAPWVKCRNLPYEGYILNQVRDQVRIFRETSKASLEFAQVLGELTIKYEEDRGRPYNFDSCETAIGKIAYFSEKHGFGLRETAWEVIDNETDLDILTMLALFCDLNNFLQQKKALTLQRLTTY